jgi:hypothetical protein
MANTLKYGAQGASPKRPASPTAKRAKPGGGKAGPESVDWRRACALDIPTLYYLLNWSTKKVCPKKRVAGKSGGRLRDGQNQGGPGAWGGGCQNAWRIGGKKPYHRRFGARPPRGCRRCKPLRLNHSGSKHGSLAALLRRPQACSALAASQQAVAYGQRYAGFRPRDFVRRAAGPCPPTPRDWRGCVSAAQPSQPPRVRMVAVGRTP